MNETERERERETERERRRRRRTCDFMWTSKNQLFVNQN